MRTQRKSWTREEEHRFIEAAARIRIEDPLITMVVVAGRAQDEIFKSQPERKRTLGAGVKAFDIYLPKIVERVHELATAPAAKESDQPPFVIDQSKPDIPALLAVMDTQVLLGELGRRLGKILETASVFISPTGSPSVATGSNGQKYGIESIPTVTRKSKTRILVVGLLDGQENHVQSRVFGNPRYKELVSLTFLKTAYRPHVPLATDYAIVEKHTPHAWWDKCKAHLPANRVFFAGGLTEVTDKIMEIANNGNS